MAKEYSVKELETMSQEDLIKLEDEAVAEEAQVADETVTTPDPKTEPEPEPKVKAEVDPVEKVEVTPTQEPAADVETVVVEPDAASTASDEEKQHISPPSKWAEQRREKKELQARAEAAEESAKAVSATEQENKDLKAQLEWISTSLESKGVDLPKAPIDAFTPEKIEEVRTEFGDELADMLQGAAAILKTQQGKVEPIVKDPEVAKPADPEPEVVVPVETQQQVDQSLIKAIDDNDELSYWKARAEDPKSPSTQLWDRAIAKDVEMLKDPVFAKLSYDDRFAKVVEAVKADVMSGAKQTTVTPTDAPGTDMGTGGVAPEPNSNSPVDKIMAASDPDVQMKLYNSMSQADKDLVDQALNI